MGQKTGVPFPVMSRISFGIRGAQLASLLRGAVAVAWFGIQTFLASVVLRVMLVAMVPSLHELDTNSILGLSTLGWIAFVALWIVQLVIVSFGMEMIRKYEAFAGPVILLTMVAARRLGLHRGRAAPSSGPASAGSKAARCGGPSSPAAPSGCPSTARSS